MNAKGGGGGIQPKTTLTMPQKCCPLAGTAAENEGFGTDVQTEWTSAQKVPSRYPCLCEWNGWH